MTSRWRRPRRARPRSRPSRTPRSGRRRSAGPRPHRGPRRLPPDPAPARSAPAGAGATRGPARRRGPASGRDPGRPGARPPRSGGNNPFGITQGARAAGCRAAAARPACPGRTRRRCRRGRTRPRWAALGPTRPRCRPSGPAARVTGPVVRWPGGPGGPRRWLPRRSRWRPAGGGGGPRWSRWRRPVRWWLPAAVPVAAVPGGGGGGTGGGPVAALAVVPVAAAAVTAAVPAAAPVAGAGRRRWRRSSRWWSRWPWPSGRCRRCVRPWRRQAQGPQVEAAEAAGVRQPVRADDELGRAARAGPGGPAAARCLAVRLRRQDQREPGLAGPGDVQPGRDGDRDPVVHRRDAAAARRAPRLRRADRQPRGGGPRAARPVRHRPRRGHRRGPAGHPARRS